MNKRASIAVLVLALLLGGCATTTPSLGAPSDILGVRLNMPRAEVRSTLAQVGTFEREERKRQEVWTVEDPRFSSLILGHDPDWNVRYVTAGPSPAASPCASPT